jgi:hypothetical protein
MGGAMGGSQTQTTNSTQKVDFPDYVTDAQKLELERGSAMTDPFLQVPNYGVMGMMPDQYLANDLARQTAQSVFTTPRITAYDAIGTGNQWMNQIPQGPQGMAQAQAGAAQQGQASVANAAQLSPDAIQPFMNPYIDAALTPALDRLKKQQGEVQAGIGADAAAAHSFGGSREAVARALADRNYRDTAGQVTGQMLQQGFDRASTLAGQNTDRSQAANLLNAQLGTQASLQNAQLGTQASLENARLGTQTSLSNSQNANALQQLLMNLTYQGSQADANRFLAAVGMESQNQDADLQRKMQMINLLNQFGGQQQALGQKSLDLPWTMLQRLSAITPQQYESTTNTDQTSKVSGGGNPLGAALGIASLFMKCDRNSKTDIEDFGTEPITGLKLYAYRYKSDPKTYPKVVGFMAQDVKEKYPDAVTEVDGTLMIDAAKLVAAVDVR